MTFRCTYRCAPQMRVARRAVTVFPNRRLLLPLDPDHPLMRAEADELDETTAILSSRKHRGRSLKRKTKLRTEAQYFRRLPIQMSPAVR